MKRRSLGDFIEDTKALAPLSAIKSNSRGFQNTSTLIPRDKSIKNEIWSWNE